MDKKQIKDMNAKWKDFRLTERTAKHGFQWKGRNILIVTGNDPITGKFRNPENRDPERNYASYIGIEGDEKKVEQAVKLIKQNLQYYKEESKGKRDFI